MISKNAVIVLVIACVMLTATFQVSAQVETQIISCSKIKSEDLRLSCYDHVAKQIAEGEVKGLNSNDKPVFIQPSQEFLRSQLRTSPDNSDFDLTINQFLSLIKSAKLESGQSVVITGWTSSSDGYVLNIRMKSPLQLIFLFDPEKHSEFSVLQPVRIKGVKVDPALFVMNMAARTM